MQSLTDPDASARVGRLITRLFFGSGVVCGVSALTFALLPLDAAAGMRELLVAGCVAVAAILVLAGVLISRITAQYLGAAAEREQRFRGLLRIAVDWYWEQDAQHRYTLISDRSEGLTKHRHALLGRTPWEVDDSGLNDAEMDRHRADLEARRPFSSLVLRRLTPRGVRYTSVSGEPKFDARGMFCGYWGVGRDINAQVLAQQATLAGEARYRGLFERSPSPLLLHRHDLVVDANDAAAQMFGVADRAAMVGFNLLEACDGPESLALMRQRSARLESLPVGQGLPVAELRMRSRSGRALTVQATAVRVDTSDGPAILSIYFDLSARVAAEAALRRSEAMLSLLFATSPDCITLTDMASGRYALVNEAFARVTGYRVDEVRGRTSIELGIWNDLADRERLVDAIRAHGRVDELPTVFRARSGTPVPMRVSAARFDMDGRDYLVINARDVSETEQALASARDAAESASRAKSAFLANTSHEIRTPLNGLLGLARLAMQEDVDPARRQQYLRQIVGSGESLAGILSDVLDLSKIEAGKFTLEAVPFALHEALAALHHSYLALAEAKGLALVLTIDDEVPVLVRADPVRVRQILSNYLTNAIKFTERGQVLLEAGVGTAGRVRLAVTDTGCGIDAAMQARLFTPFMQADDSTTRRHGGTGLGLSICRELATLMGGEVGATSAPGAGSTFWAELPLPVADAAPAEGASEPLDSLRGQRVLMVEDNPVNMMIGVAMLEQWGIDVAQAVDGQHAIEAVERATAQGEPFDVVLMDVQMPEMSGHEAARRLRERHSAQTLPIIALTAAALVSERDQAIRAGMNDFLTKPIDTRKLQQALMRYGARH